ncbi:hypothetical protein FACS189490_00850 [Clostridia bacterium]|nr:hypothetical protein FACS189490_00850 [Clostridia bacterium]
MKRFCAAVVLLCIMLTSASCESVPSEDVLKILRPFVTFFAKTFLPKPDGKILEERLLEILEALENHDADALKGMLSEQALLDAKDLDNSIVEFMDYYQGTHISYNDKATTSSARSAFGNTKERVLSAAYTITTEVDEYRILFDDYVVYKKNPKKEGTYNVHIIRLSDYNKHNFKFENGAGFFVIKSDSQF